jgi:DNA-binding Lrp family transcriptional regulator
MNHGDLNLLSPRHFIIVNSMKTFIFVKTSPGREVEVATRLKSIPSIDRVYLIPGEFDLLAVLDHDSTFDISPETKIAQLLLNSVRKLEHVADTETIIPVESISKLTDMEATDAFVFLRTQPGRAKEVLRKLNKLPEVKGAHLVFGEADLFVQLQVDGANTETYETFASIVREKIAKVKWVSSTETLLPIILHETSAHAPQAGISAN